MFIYCHHHEKNMFGFLGVLKDFKIFIFSSFLRSISVLKYQYWYRILIFVFSTSVLFSCPLFSVFGSSWVEVAPNLGGFGWVRILSARKVQPTFSNFRAKSGNSGDFSQSSVGFRARFRCLGLNKTDFPSNFFSWALFRVGMGSIWGPI